MKLPTPDLRSHVPLVVGLALVATGVALSRDDSAGHSPWGPLAPLARLAADVQWVRVDEAFRAGDPLRAFDLAERAVALDPGATHGWALLVNEQIVVLAGELRASDPRERRAWIESGLASAERALVSAREPAVVALVAALALHVQTQGEVPVDWPSHPNGLVGEARAWLERARDLGAGEALTFLNELETR
jgi:hypothetical protein